MKELGWAVTTKDVPYYKDGKQEYAEPGVVFMAKESPYAGCFARFRNGGCANLEDHEFRMCEEAVCLSDIKYSPITRMGWKTLYKGERVWVVAYNAPGPWVRVVLVDGSYAFLNEHEFKIVKEKGAMKKQRGVVTKDVFRALENHKPVGRFYAGDKFKVLGGHSGGRVAAKFKGGDVCILSPGEFELKDGGVRVILRLNNHHSDNTWCEISLLFDPIISDRLNGIRLAVLEWIRTDEGMEYVCDGKSPLLTEVIPMIPMEITKRWGFEVGSFLWGDDTIKTHNDQELDVLAGQIKQIESDAHNLRKWDVDGVLETIGLAVVVAQEAATWERL